MRVPLLLVLGTCFCIGGFGQASTANSSTTSTSSSTTPSPSPTVAGDWGAGGFTSFWHNLTSAFGSLGTGFSGFGLTLATTLGNGFTKHVSTPTSNLFAHLANITRGKRDLGALDRPRPAPRPASECLNGTSVDWCLQCRAAEDRYPWFDCGAALTWFCGLIISLLFFVLLTGLCFLIILLTLSHVLVHGPPRAGYWLVLCCCVAVCDARPVDSSLSTPGESVDTPWWHAAVALLGFSIVVAAVVWNCILAFTLRGFHRCCSGLMASLALFYLLLCARLASGDPFISSRACTDNSTPWVYFSNCCAEDDLVLCTSHVCWTKVGCVPCTETEGCWSSLGGGVSMRPGPGSTQARRDAMNAIGAAGLAAYAAEAVGLGEVYSGVLVFGIFGVRRTTPLKLICGKPCMEDVRTWMQLKAPTLTTIVEWASRIPNIIWTLIVGMPFLFAVLLGYTVVRGHWVVTIILALGVPGIISSGEVQCVCGNETATNNCTLQDVDRAGVSCYCPFGQVIKHYPLGHRFGRIPIVCPERYDHEEDWWFCVWGSWWWVHQGVTVPYAHPFSPPDPYSALCYISDSGSAAMNRSIFVRTWAGYDGGFGGNVTTCLLDRREKACGDCYGGCYQLDRDNSRPFARCGGGYKDGPIIFLPLAVVRYDNNSANAWWRPNRAVAELLISSRYRHGVGCGDVGGVIHCWSCFVHEPPERGWLPQPGRPTDLCINPQYERRQLGYTRNWLETIQYVADSLWAGTGCPVYDVPAYPVCKHMAWFPADGSRVTMSGGRQVVGALPESYLGFVGLFGVLLALMVASGARLIPLLLVIVAAVTQTRADCYPSCTYCNYILCVSSSRCAALADDSFYMSYNSHFSVRQGYGLPEWLTDLGPIAVPTAWLCHLFGVPSLSSLVVGARLLGSLVEVAEVDFYCGNATEPSLSVDGYDFTYLLYAILPLFGVSTIWTLGSFLGVCAGLRLRAKFPWRICALILQYACDHSLNFAVCLAVVVQVYDSAVGGIPYAEAALHRGLIAAPAMAASFTYPTWIETVLGCFCVLFYARTVGRVGLAPLVAYKLSRGLLGVTILVLLCARSHDRGVLGASNHSLEICIPVDWMSVSADDTWWYLSSLICFLSVVLAFHSITGKRIRLRLYARWCKIYCALRLLVGVSPVGRYGRFSSPTMLAWLVCCLLWPRECGTVGLLLVACAAAVDLADWALEAVLCVTPKHEPIGRAADLAARCLNNAELSALLQRWWYKGWLLYEHMGQVSLNLRERVVAMGGCLEPVAIRPEELHAVYDDTMTLTCGRWYGGSPVVARCGNAVLIGSAKSVSSLPPGYTLTAPLLVVRPRSGFFSILKTSLLGRGEVPGTGQVVVFETATGTSMGVATNGVLYATFHGTSGRPLAGPNGPRNPYWTSPSDDVACYPLLEGLSCLEACSCGDHSRWMVRVDGQLVHGVQSGEDHVVLDCPTPLDKIKGASGSPVLCDNGHAVGMLVGAISNGGVVQRIRYVRPWKAIPGNPKGDRVPEFPTVPTEGYKCVGYVAPTGSGKSTKLPMALAALGHRVLVLNPSVVTTKSMYKYIKEVSGKSPNVFAGTGKGAMAIRTGSRITYVTYGRFLVNPEDWLANADVVICDECHAVDGTSILGIGAALSLAEAGGVKLTIMATATPPGTVITPHDSITEVPLDSNGDIPFYGLTIKSEQYKTGRHVIFCHSKAECTRVASELSRAGVNAVTFWRGADPANLSDDPNLTVVATDAISTGYTGNFATCTDCCSVVCEEVEVDLNPTFSLLLGVRAADAALRMQRRGRCGRGAPGTYRPVISGAPPTGMTSSAAAWSAAEAGYVWYGRTEQQIVQWLEAYQSCAYTCRMPGDFAEAVRALGVLKPFFRDEEVAKLCLKDQSWPLLYGAQRRLCLTAESAPPSDDIKWAGIIGLNAVPLLFRLGTVTAPCVSHILTKKLAEVLGDASYQDASMGPLLLAGVGIAAAVAIVGATGCLSISSVWEVFSGGSPTIPGSSSEKDRGRVQEGGPVPVDALREVATSLDYPFLSTVWGALEQGSTFVRNGASDAAQAVKAWYTGGTPVLPVVQAIPEGVAGARILEILHAHMMAIAAGGLAVVGSRSSPGLATIAALVAGVQTLAPTHVIWLLAIAGGMAVSLASSPQLGAAAAGAFYIGNKIGSFSILNTIMNCVTGYEACVSTCALTLELMDGTANAMSWASALVAVVSPGAAVGGIALALILRGAGGGDVSAWMNRLLSCLPRNNVLPDGFFVDKKDPHALAKAVRSLSLTSRLAAWCEASRQDDYVFCADGWLNKLMRVIGAIYAYVRNWVVDHLPVPGIPYVSCSVAYKGKLKGTGSVSTKCACGHGIAWDCSVEGQAEQGEINKGKTRWLCRCSATGGLPINTTTVWTGDLRVDLSEEREFMFRLSASHSFVVFMRPEVRTIKVLSSTCRNLTKKMILDAIAEGPVAAGGAPVSPFWAGDSLASFTAGQSITYEGELVKLPFEVTGVPQICTTPCSPRLFEVTGAPEAEARAAEAAEVASEAVKLADQTMEAAAGLITTSIEARRKAEAEAWALREKMMGRDLFEDGCDSKWDDQDDVCMTNRHLYAMINDDAPTPVADKDPEQGLLEVLGEPAVLPLTEDNQVKPVETDELFAPTPLSQEAVLDGVAEPELMTDLRDSGGEVAEAMSYAGAMVANIGRGAMLGAKTVVEAVAKPVRVVTNATAQAATSAKWKVKDLAKAAATKLPSITKEVVEVAAEITSEEPLTIDVTTARYVTFKWSCGSGGECIVTTSDDDSLEDALSRSKVPTCHDHKLLAGVLELHRREKVHTLCEISLDVTCVCPKHPDERPKGRTTTRTLVHRCCGKDESRTKAMGINTPTCLLDSLWGDTAGGRWLCNGKEIPMDTIVGTVEGVYELVHETPCGLSYLWSGAPIVVGEPKKHPVTRPLTAHLRADATKVYVTDPQAIHQRIAKVTIEQVPAVEDGFLRDAYNLALAKASRVLNPGFDYDTAVSKVRPNSARGHVANITVADLKTPRGRKAVEDCLDGIRTGTEEGRFMLRPKSEVFPQTKSTYKPPRLICYPSLEFRVAEKMILGDPSVVAKAVMGEAYGFQHPPHKRAEVLYRMWKSKRQPMCYTLDGVCFDSTITQEDIGRESEIFARASPDPGLVRRLHAYYAESPMVGPDGRIVGIRRCRASGTLTTSAGNSITCYLKVTAACRKAGIQNPSFLIHGDDVVVICERSEENLCRALGDALTSYGYVCEPVAHADLSTAESCSATVTMVRTVRGMQPTLTTDMRRGLGRVLAEVGDPVGTAWGYTINYPTNPIVSCVLLPILLTTALNSGEGVNQLINVDIRGNTIQMPLSSLGKAIRGLHGPSILCVTGRAPSDIQQAADVLQFFNMRGLGFWRRNRAKVRVRLMRAGRDWASLARELLWDPACSMPPVLDQGEGILPPELWEWSWEGLAPIPVRDKPVPWRVKAAIAILGLFALSVVL
ncbi:polyprotein [Pegivirus scotophili]|uniref:Genome polyprotein n=1 Tax=bat pegivirus G TaxID=2758121 RepID=M9ZU32_9FLAV|nr:polyprotein [Pegivirus scotophili]AGK41006.1 polyprotein [bat pegivirus G]